MNDYTVELNIEANERDLAFIDYQLSQLEDQAFSTAESIALLEQKYLSLSESSSDYEDGINSIFQFGIHTYIYKLNNLLIAILFVSPNLNSSYI